MKICIYAIAKNEAKFAQRFMDACAAADTVAVLDTGSTDGTAEALRALGAIVEERIIEPWRFDTARNAAMALIPADTDVCVSLDLDEVLLPGWREALERAWTDGAELGEYTCVCSRASDGTAGTVFRREKLHARGAAEWIYPVHEVLRYTGARKAPVRVSVPEMVCEHRPDESKSRAQYLPLLQLAAEENPNDPRCAHYLGRELMYHGRWREAIAEFERHLSLAAWKEERAASLRYMSECLLSLGDRDTALRRAIRSTCEADMRECWYEAEKVCYFRGDWEGVIYFGTEALRRTARSESAINEAEAWGAAVDDLLSLGYYYTGRTGEAIAHAKAALKLDEGNERIRKNLALMRAAQEKRGGGR